MLQHFSELIDKVKAMPRTVVCVANADSETVEAARMALDKGLADVILYGDEAVVRPLVEQAGIEGRAELRHAADPATALREAVRSVRGGESGVLMKGMLNSSDFLRGVLNKEEGLRTGRRLSHIAAVELPGYHKLIYSTDGGMNINPDLAAKKDILANALLALRSWGYECPKVAASPPTSASIRTIPRPSTPPGWSRHGNGASSPRNASLKAPLPWMWP